MKHGHVILFGLLACAFVATTLEAQAQKQSLTFGGQPRTYLAYMPDGADKVPLIVLLHGSGRDAVSITRPWEAIAKKERIALLAPDSKDRQGWNHADDGPAFVYQLVETARAGGRIDSRRLYLFGHSAGGHHGIDLGLLESEYFAAVAVHAGALTRDEELMTTNASRKIPIAMWNGTDDRAVPIALVRKSRDTRLLRARVGDQSGGVVVSEELLAAGGTKVQGVHHHEVGRTRTTCASGTCRSVSAHRRAVSARASIPSSRHPDRRHATPGRRLPAVTCR